jgi:HEAT repeats
MLSKVLKGKAQSNAAVFCDFQAPFLVAHGGITLARQVREMAALLGRELDEARLFRIAKDVERLTIPELDSCFLRDVAEAFRQTIPTALNETETGPAAATEPTEPAESVASGASDDSGAEPGPDIPEGQPYASPDKPLAAALVAWQSVLRDLIPPEPANTLSPDEAIAVVLEWEDQQPDPRLVDAVWEWLGWPETLEKLRQRERLDFVLRAGEGQKSWNQLEWEWLNHALAETARRQAGQAQLSPSQLLAFATDLGQVAFEAIQADTQQGARPTVDLAQRPSRWPSGQPADWHWLIPVAHAGPLRLSISAAGVCQFESREETEFLAGQYVLNAGTEQLLVGIARNCGRPFGVLWQAVRSLHFAGRDEAVGKLIKELRHVPEDIALWDADAAHLLAACEAPANAGQKAIWQSIEAALCLLWWRIHETEYRTYIARALHDPDWTRFRDLVQGTLGAEWVAGRPSDSILRSLAILRGEDTVEKLWTLTQKPVPAAAPGQPQVEPWSPLQALLAVAADLALGEQITLLERLALGATELDGRRRAVQALAEVGSIPAIRALDRIAATAVDPAVARYAETQRMDVDSPAHAALVARELDAAVAGGERDRLMLRTHTASGLLWHSRSASVLARSLARVWASLDLAEEARIAAALGLTNTHAAPALDICLGTLPLADQDGSWESDMLPQMLLALSATAATPRLWLLVDRAPSPAQRAILIRCLGRAGGMALDGRFEQLLVGPSEPVAVVAVAALAEALGPAAAERLVQIAAGDGRPSVRTAAKEGLAEIGSDWALPYLREKLQDPNQHANACGQLARLHHPEAEKLLVQAVRSENAGLARDHVYVRAVAKSGGAAAVQALRDVLGSEPDKMTVDPVPMELPPDTVTGAPDVWRRLIDDASPAWRMTAVTVLARDPSQTLIELVVRVAVEGIDRTVRKYARHRLQRDIPKIVSPAATEYVLDQLEQQVAQFGQPASSCWKFYKSALADSQPTTRNCRRTWPAAPWRSYGESCPRCALPMSASFRCSSPSPTPSFGHPLASLSTCWTP